MDHYSPNCSSQKSSVKGEASLSPTSLVSSTSTLSPCLLLLLPKYISNPSVSLHPHCVQPNPEIANCHFWKSVLPGRLFCFTPQYFLKLLTLFANTYGLKSLTKQFGFLASLQKLKGLATLPYNSTWLKLGGVQ